jgi:hypothetical protein
MTQQSVRQAARRAALDVQSKRRRERAEREKRLEAMALDVLVAVRERDAAVSEAERRAGAALRRMTDEEGLSLREALSWCGEEIGTREATRLRRVVDETDGAHHGEMPGDAPDAAAKCEPDATSLQAAALADQRVKE